MAGLVALVCAGQPERHPGGFVGVEDFHAAGCDVARAAPGSGAEASDGDRFGLGDEAAHGVSESVGHLRGSDEFQGREVEQGPVEGFELDGGVGDLAVEALADHRHGFTEEGIEAGADRGDSLGPTGWVAQQPADSLLGAAAFEEPIALQQWLQPPAAHLTAGGLVVPSGSLPDLIRSALATLAPAIDAAEEQARQRSRQ